MSAKPGRASIIVATHGVVGVDFDDHSVDRLGVGFDGRHLPVLAIATDIGRRRCPQIANNLLFIF